MSTIANCYYCGDRVVLDLMGSKRAVLCVNPECGAQGPLRDRRCDAIEAWNGVAARLGTAPADPYMPMLFVRATPIDLVSH
jgi:hypothetical protein